MYIEQELFEDDAPRDNSKNTESYKNIEGNFFRIYDLIEPVYSTNKQIFEFTEGVFSKYRKSLKMYDQQNLMLNHDELFELTYKIVEYTVKEILKVKYNSIDDLMEVNLNTLTLFLTPSNITDEEMIWSEKFMSKRKGEYEVEFKLPEDAERNYYINFKRILDENNSNPDFNESILNFLDRTRDPD
jgi:preprotein translocase subunit SecA